MGESFIPRCSSACTKAGITALLAAAMAVSLLQPLYQADALLRYAQYVDLRDDLSRQITALREAVCWQRWSAAHPEELSHISLGQIARIRCYQDILRAPLQLLLGRSRLTPEEVSELSKKYPLVRDWPEDDARRRMPGKLGTVLRGGFHQLPQGFEIAETMSKLSDLVEPHLLRKVGVASPRTARSMQHWKESLIIQLTKVGWHQPATKGVSDALSGRDLAALQLPVEALLNYLVMASAEELATLEMPDDQQTDNMLIAQKISLPQISISLGLGAASLMLQFAMFLSLGYFFLFQREALLLIDFPGTATVFSVFRGSIAAEWSFRLLCCLPPIASLLLLLSPLSFPEKIVNGALCVLIVTLASGIANKFSEGTLRKHSYV